MGDGMLRVATWKLGHPRGDPDAVQRQAAFAASVELDLLLLQDVRLSELGSFTGAGRFDWTIGAAELQVPPPKRSGLLERSAAIAGRGARPRATRLFTHVPQPTRMLLVEVDTALGPLIAVSSDTVTVRPRDAALEHTLALARWLERVQGTVLVGVNTDSLRTDHPDRRRIRTRRPTGRGGLQTGEPGDDLMFGPRPIHRLGDAMRRWLDHHPDELAQARRDRPDGPLAVTHQFEWRDETLESRRDLLWVTADLEVATIDHHYQAAVDAGSDHALVVADLTRDDGGTHVTARTRTPDQGPAAAVRAPAPKGQETAQHVGLADRLFEATRVPAAALTAEAVPDGPGVYVWWDGDEPIFVGAAESLADQLLERDLRGGQRPVAPFRQVIRERLKAETAWPRGESKSDRIAAIDGFIAVRCLVSWSETSTVDDAYQSAEQVSDDLLDDAGWAPRPGEDQLLRSYLDGLDPQGRVFVEVPIGGGQAGVPRRIDAVRFPTLPDAVNYFDRDQFDRSLSSGALELIEVKASLNRPVFGQLVTARELALTEWDLASSDDLRAVAVVGRSDPTLEPIFARYDIDVIVIDP